MPIDRVPGPGALTRLRLASEHSAVEVVPERGGLVTRYQHRGREVLFLDEATLVDPTKNVRGGVPLLFPFAGKPPPGSSLGQHGFARKLPWDVVTEAPGPQPSLTLRLTSTPDTLAAWPHAFRCDYTIALTDAGLELRWAFHNPGPAAYPLHFGIHPYFLVPDKAKASLEVGLPRAYDNRLGAERAVGPLALDGDEVDLHFHPYARGGLAFPRGDGRVLDLRWNEPFSTLVVWTLPGQPFVCLEPWTARGQQPSALLVEPGATTQLLVRCQLE